MPDECDLDSNDPDGDEWVSPDCNENEFPDECDIALGPAFGSLDCNGNDIPDECDIANCDPEDPDCQDCNGNGFPDGCDIAAEINLDENGIPDECEGASLLGGDGFTGETPVPQATVPQGPPFFGDPEAYESAWDEYYEWLDEQDWGPASEYSGAEQFRLMVDKLNELGLPVRNPRS